MNSIKRGLFIAVLLACTLSNAKTKKTTEPVPEVDQDYSIPVQQDSVQIGGSNLDFKPNVVDYELSTSNWLPSQFSRPSLLTQNTAFAAGSLPLISVSRISPIMAVAGGNIESDLGFSYASLVRNGIFNSGSGDVTVQEKMTVLSAQIGVSYRMFSLGTKYIQPSIEVALLPTWISSERSAFETYGVSATGLAYQGALKLLYCPDFIQKNSGLTKTGEGFGLGYLQTAGSVSGSDMSGSGWQAILRMSL